MVLSHPFREGSSGNQCCFRIITKIVAETESFTATGVSIIWRGCVVAMSSTAVVVRLLVDRGEIDAPRGREALSVLLAQDVAVVPMLIMVGILGSIGGPDASRAEIAAEATEKLADAAFGLLLIVAILAVIGVFLLPRLLGASVFRRNRDFAIVIAIISCMVAAWGSHAVGLSPALGAFLAGLLFAETEYRHEIEVDIAPFKGLLLGLFFVSVGMSGLFQDTSPQPRSSASTKITLGFFASCDDRPT